MAFQMVFTLNSRQYFFPIFKMLPAHPWRLGQAPSPKKMVTVFCGLFEGNRDWEGFPGIQTFPGLLISEEPASGHLHCHTLVSPGLLNSGEPEIILQVAPEPFSVTGGFCPLTYCICMCITWALMSCEEMDLWTDGTHTLELSTLYRASTWKWVGLTLAPPSRHMQGTLMQGDVLWGQERGTDRQWVLEWPSPKAALAAMLQPQEVWNWPASTILSFPLPSVPPTIRGPRAPLLGPRSRTAFNFGFFFFNFTSASY